MRGAELKAMRAAERRSGPRKVLLQDMKHTVVWIEAALVVTEPSIREVIECVVDANLILNAEMLERLGYHRFAARVRASISELHKEQPRRGPHRGGPPPGRGGNGGSGQGAGLRIGYAPAVAAVGAPRTWH